MVHEGPTQDEIISLSHYVFLQKRSTNKNLLVGPNETHGTTVIRSGAVYAVGCQYNISK